jgi:hypothetical protein
MLAMPILEDMVARTTSRKVLHSQYRHKPHNQAEHFREVTQTLADIRDFEEEWRGFRNV